MSTEQGTAPAAPTSTRRSPLHHWHLAHGARLGERDGWQIPLSYADVSAELAAARAALGEADVSAFAKVSVRGPDVASFIPAPRGVVTLPDGPALACRLTDDHLLLLASTTSTTALDRHAAGLREGRSVVQTDVTSAYAGFWLVGPRLEELLRRVTHLDIRLSAFPVNSCAETAFAGVEALLVRPAEDSLRVYLAWDLGEYVWERMLEAGRDVPITPMGLEALALLAS
jgi:heterotetrameric sarcosine oxidase gamma subunit